MRVTVTDECIACGACEALCPDVFKVGDDRAVVVMENVLANADCIKDAAEGCPVNAIIVE